MNDNADQSSGSLKTWAQYVDLLKPAAQVEDLVWEAGGEQVRAELYRQFLMNLSLGYFLHFQSSPTHPDWAPLFNSVFLLQPNPDDVYLIAPVEESGVYRISGERGSVYILTFSTNFLAPGMSEDIAGTRAFDLFDADELTLDENGCFEVILSAERPQGYEGDWWYLHPEASTVWVRQRSYDWHAERDGRFAIERLDAAGLVPKPRMSVAAIHRNITDLLSGFTPRLSRKLLKNQNGLRERVGVNVAEMATFGGVLPIQGYWQAVFQFAEDEVIILETDIPETVQYWNLQTNDEIFNAVDFVCHQSSLNGHQARLDTDGRFRAVLSVTDPCVPNWLDSGGSLEGTLIGRWYAASTHPLPVLKRVPLSDLRAHLPNETPKVSPEERQSILRTRRIASQLRKRW